MGMFSSMLLLMPKPIGNRVFLPQLGLPNCRFMCQQQTSVHWQTHACIIGPMAGHQTHHHILLGEPKLRDRKVSIGDPAEQEPRALSRAKEVLGLTITEASSRKKKPNWSSITNAHSRINAWCAAGKYSRAKKLFTDFSMRFAGFGLLFRLLKN